MRVSRAQIGGRRLASPSFKILVLNPGASHARANSRQSINALKGLSGFLRGTVAITAG